MDEWQKAALLRDEKTCNQTFTCHACKNDFLCTDYKGHPWKEHQNETHRSAVE